MSLRLAVLAVLLLTSPAAAQKPRPSSSALERERALGLAAAEIAAGRRAEAMQVLRSAADRFQSVQALLQLARLQSADGDAAGAVDSLVRARALAPNSEDVLSALAQVSLAAHSPLPAILTLQPLTRICPSVAQYHYLLGVALMQAGDMPAAVESLTEAERLDSDRVLTLLALGFAQNNRKLYSEARTFLLRSLELEPENLDAMAALAESEEGLGELPAAEDQARRVLAKAATHATANLVMGMVLMKQERYEEARDALERALGAQPASSKAQYQLSLAHARLGDEIASQQYLDLYRQTLRETEERLKKLRTETGPAGGGMRP